MTVQFLNFRKERFMLGGIMAGVTVAKMVSDMKKSDEINERAQKKRVQAMRTLSDAENDRRCEEEKMHQAILKLATRKKGILTTSIERFIDVYGKIKQIKFNDSDGIRELDTFSPSCCNDMKNQIIFIQQKDLSSDVVFTKNVVVNLLFLGLPAAITTSIVNEAQNELNMASSKLKQARVLAEQQKIYSLSYQAISERADRMKEILTALNVLFVKSLNNTEEIIEKKGNDRKRYETTDIMQIGTCLNLAKAVKDILDAPILDQEGELAKESMAAIERGNQCVIEMNNNLDAI